MKILEKIKNFFSIDSSEVVGVYHDGEKLFLAQLTDGVKVMEVNFEIDDDENISPIEQLAEKVAFLCSKNGWSTSKTALCLREGETVTFQPDFKNIPQEKIESAVKIWANVQAGENSLYTYAQICGEFWSETISKSLAEKYIAAWEKNSMNLCLLTSLTGIFSDKAVFVARLAAEKKSPNLLENKIEKYDYKKIFAFAAGIFFIFATFFLSKNFWQLHETQKIFENLQENLSTEIEINDETEKILTKNFSKSANFHAFFEKQIPKQKLNALIALGKIADEKIKITKINISENAAEIEGSAKQNSAIRNYLSRLKNSFAKTANLERVEAEKNSIIFKIHFNF